MIPRWDSWPLARQAQWTLEVAAGQAAAASEPLSEAHVLFALAVRGEAEGPAKRSADVLRQVLGPHPAFSELAGRYVPQPQLLHEGGESPASSSLMVTVFDWLHRAARLARETTEAAEIEVRHLVGAMFAHDAELVPEVRATLEHLAVEPEAVRRAFFAYLRDRQRDDVAAWHRALFGEPETLISTFHADATGGRDALGITPYVNAFAALIASRTLVPPLSIGLFGEWGSGKSFFMHRLRERIDTLAAKARDGRRPQRETPFYKRIVQIEFNAWHYSEGNLWASLVDHVFRRLHAPAGPTPAPEEMRRGVLSRLQTATTEHRQAEAEVAAAEEARRTAEQQATVAKAELDAKTEELSELSAKNLLADLQDVRDLPEMRAVAQRLGIDRATTDVRTLLDEIAQAKAVVQRAGPILAPLVKERRRLAYLILVLVVPLVAGPLVAMGLEQFPWLRERVSEWWAVVATFLGGAAAWLRSQTRWANERLDELEKAQAAYDRRLGEATAEHQQKVESAREELRVQEAAYLSARAAEEDAARRVAAAQAQVDRATSPALLSSFIGERTSSDEYRRHLGLLAVVREDFRKLSELIEAENRKLELAPPADGCYADLAAEEAEASTRINRIVLYIDDLDRCPPARVVEVLQAVHLLLAFPLFTVVVGVDARWVTRSLEVRYRELLAREGGGEDDADDFFGRATPMDYLEKIFQIPFWLRPMREEDSRRLLRALLAATDTTAAEDPAPADTVDPSGESNVAPDAIIALPNAEPNVPSDATIASLPSAAADAAEPSAGAPEATSGDAEAEASPAVPSRVTAGGARKGARKDDAADPETTSPAMQARSLELSPGEREAMLGLSPLLGRSPRALKRFVNVYRVVKAGLGAHELETLTTAPEDGRFAAADAILLLLAIDTGTPAAARPFFAMLQRMADADELGACLRRLDTDEEAKAAPDWPRLRAHLLDAAGRLRLPDDARTLRTWLARISRFSFHAEPAATALAGTAAGRAEDGIA